MKKYLCVLAMGLTAMAVMAQDIHDVRAMIESGELKRCGTADVDMDAPIYRGVGGSGADCSTGLTNPSPFYEPVDTWEITVVVHIISNTSGQGNLSDAAVHSQIDILNEDFLALPGTPGENGFDSKIRFVLATEDPDGNPTTGITRSVNDTWFNDNGDYYNQLAWDVSRYMNIYTNNAGGFLGYTYIPQTASQTPFNQRIVILHSAFGRNSPFTPYDQGRTATHEVGHFLGLFHTFGSCGITTPPDCYSTGDTLCDTAAHSSSNGGCPTGTTACGGIISPIENYMNYTDDTCMQWFSQEQVYRMRCSMQFYREGFYTVAGSTNCDNSDLSAEAGDSLWVCEGGSVTLNGSATLGAGSYDFMWAPGESLSDETIANPLATPPQTTTYVLNVTDADNCSSEDSVTVYVIPTNTYTYTSEWLGDYTDYDYDQNGVINLLDLVSLTNLCND